MLDPKNITDYLRETEALVPNLRPGCEKRVIWAGAEGQKTRYVLLYVHGFSATGEELRPLPDLVAGHLGANIFFTRLDGHGQDGPAMARATFADWQQDMAEAFDIAAALGDEVVIMGCSTGCTLATLSLAQGRQAAAVVHVSPNYGLTNRAAQMLLDMPYSRVWGKYLVGRERNFDPINAAHAKFWTTRYPTEAVSTMADAVRAVRGADLSTIRVPAFFAFNDADTVVNPVEIRKVIGRWGGDAEALMITPQKGDDPNGHVMAGDIFSPGQTAPLVQQISAWSDRILRDAGTCTAPARQAN
ncbi:alpha/beta hydrolase [Yoonia sediminilitoris]|uniref:Esterase/lipase n=1 Tax=Yoonia sediminilitoris TaxID=1286148 RepID=A0A2T6KJT6_9RHOB|nr:alpha/beta fold hydrolase [Yoonia sediminilitoris]PUB16227.1 esterase/lipase [Yoonia sediminilitoris]RCW96576.1 esterase/lipase [Yoonia sediminilitoris]